MNEDSRKTQDKFKAKVIATGFSIFFVIMGLLTIYSHFQYTSIHPEEIKISLSKIDIYMGLLQISLGMLPLTICFKDNKARYVWSIALVTLASIFLILMYLKMTY